MNQTVHRVAVAMSGGVDSSVAAALLVKQGYDVTGVMLRLWNEPGTDSENRCCSPDSMLLARKAAARLDIPFYVLDASQYFYDKVVKNFIDGYTSGITPNPCLFCNRYVRWEFLLDQIYSFGIETIATGHYARSIYSNDKHEYQLFKAVDASKDQSYVLSFLTQDKLCHTLFPLGDLTKQQVRQIARELNLPSADRPESQDLCFLGDMDYRAFLKQHASEKIIPGPIQSEGGKVLGQHKGLAFYTIGQRKGLGISSPHPLYVLEKDTKENALIVGRGDHTGKRSFMARHINWISGEKPEASFAVNIKIRYRSPEISAIVHLKNDDNASINLEISSREITPGQIVVFYDKDLCLGGGIIV
jgi:tRNA-uridine 2-sulfurtransferase